MVANYKLGVFLLCMVVILWTSSATVQQYIENGEYDKPFLITYYNGSSFSLYTLYLVFKKDFRSEIAEYVSYLWRTKCGFRPNYDDKPRIYKMIKVAFIFSVFWYTANGLFSVALLFSSVSSVTTISSLSGLFTLLLGSIRPKTIKDSFSISKLFFALLSVVGVLFIGLSEKDSVGVGSSSMVVANSTNTTLVEDPSQNGQNLRWLGDLIAFISAVLYAVYLVYLEHNIEDSDDQLFMAKFFGFVGCFTLFTFWPVLLIAHFTKVEPLALPSGFVFMLMTLNAVLGSCISEFLWIWSALLTSPLVASLGLSLTIPLAIVFDAIFFDVHNTSAMFFVGTILVFASFVGVNLVIYDPISKVLNNSFVKCCGERVASWLVPYEEEMHVHGTQEFDMNTDFENLIGDSSSEEEYGFDNDFDDQDL